MDETAVSIKLEELALEYISCLIEPSADRRSTAASLLEPTVEPTSSRHADTVTFTESQAKKTAYLFAIVNESHRLIVENQHATLRDVFYSQVALFRHQRNSNRTIADVTRIVKVPREFLRISSTPRGIIRGPILLKESQYWKDANNPFESRGLLIPNGIIDIKFTSSINFVLVVEKETVFYRLLDLDFLDKYGPCILLTSRGYPDLPSRKLLHLIASRAGDSVPIFAVVDFDAHGLQIAAMYAFGPKKTNWHIEVDLTVPSLKLIPLPGVKIAIESFGLQPEDCRALLPQDTKSIERLRGRIQMVPEKTDIHNWRAAIDKLLSSGLKYELDCLQRLEMHIGNHCNKFKDSGCE